MGGFEDKRSNTILDEGIAIVKVGHHIATTIASTTIDRNPSLPFHSCDTLSHCFSRRSLPITIITFYHHDRRITLRSLKKEKLLFILSLSLSIVGFMVEKERVWVKEECSGIKHVW